MGILSLTVTTGGKLPVKNNDLENKDVGNEKKLEKWQLSVIIGTLTFSILLVTILLICGVNRASKNKVTPVRTFKGQHSRTAQEADNETYHGGRNQLQHDNFDDVIVNKYA